VISLNPSKKDKGMLRARMEARREGEKSKKKEHREKREKRREKKEMEGKPGNGVDGHKEGDGVKENEEKSEKKEKGEKANGEKTNGTIEQGISAFHFDHYSQFPQFFRKFRIFCISCFDFLTYFIPDKKGKKREIESSTSEPSTKTSKLNPSSSSSSSSKRTTSSSSTTTTTTTSTTTYTPHVTPHGGERDDAKGQPALYTVPKTAAYNSLFRDQVRKSSNANKLFSGIY
jgi:hypothetical protein